MREFGKLIVSKVTRNPLYIILTFEENRYEAVRSWVYVNYLIIRPSAQCVQSCL